MLLSTTLSSFVQAQKGEELIDLKFHTMKHLDKNIFVIKMKLEPGWHVYWKNPGDSGIATDWKFQTKNKTIDISMLEWPSPTLYKEAGELWTFGYSGEKFFFAEFTKNKTIDDELTLVAEFLVCKELCIPAKHTIAFDSKNGQVLIPAELKITEEESRLHDYFKTLPAKTDFPTNWNWKLYHLENTSQMRLIFTLPNNTFLPKDGHLLTAFPSQPFNFKHFTNNTQQLLMEIDWDGQYQEPAISLPSGNQFTKSFELQFLWHQANNISSKFSLNIDQLTHVNEAEWKKLELSTAPVITNSPSINTNIIFMLLFALIGGFILNFMPCVLPVISLKLYGLIHHAKKSKADLIKHHGAYTIGVVLSFWVLALIIILIKQSGEAIGWGFQLQSPSFVWIMIIIFFILALNLFGLFEFKTPGGKVIANARSKHPYIDDFLAGLLAVVVATPCSAPFLGPALTYAFAENAFIILLMFTAIGLGLSLPFIITAAFPQSLNILPRPGAWMNMFKYLMGLALLVSCVWLFEVLQHLGNFSQISFMLYLNLALIFFSIFIYQKEKKMTPIVIFMFCFTTFNFYRSFHLLSHNFTQSEKTSLEWQPWSEEKIQNLLTSKDIFFIDATAKWCITCQVNKKLVFETSAFNKLIEKHQLKTIQLDWTKKDAAMFSWMQKHGAVSVPAYFLGTKGKIIFLGETISVGKIEDALQNP